jgi:DNA mismatch repair protein MutS2
MAFHPGDHVHVVALGKGVVREVRNGARYLVEIKGRSLLVAGDQLERIDPPKRGREARGHAALPAPDAASPRGGPPSLDLHGKTVDEALEALDTFLSDALLEGHAEVRVIHGRSGGRLKAAVHARLREISAVRVFRVDPQNAGVTMVVFRAL